MGGGTLQPVVGAALHGGKFEYPEPSPHVLFQSCFGLIRGCELPVEVGEIVGDLLLDFLFSRPTEGFALFGSLLIRIPDYAVPAAICPLEDVAVCQ